MLQGLCGHNPTFVVETELQKDIRWWATLLERYNGVTMIPDVIWVKPDTVIATYTSLGGGGGVNCQLMGYFHFEFPLYLLEETHHINRLELECLVVAVKLWGPFLDSNRILLYCANEAAVTVVNS